MKTITEETGLEQGDYESAESFQNYLREQARRALMEVIEQEVESLCGKRYHPTDGIGHTRGGSAPSYVLVGGKRESMNRPRVRREKGGKSEEVRLKSWKLAQSPEEWESAMIRATLCGVSTRDIPQLRETELAGESRSSLSRLWQRKSAELVEEMQERDLTGFQLTVLMLDAVVLSGGLVATVALGIDDRGNKEILGFRGYEWET